jgi:beta-galactosidase GanA
VYGVCNSKSFPRLPVPALWLDVFQKIRALGYTGVSFYVDWALLEGDPGTFKADGVFDLDPFFEAATQAGIYLLAVNDGLCAMD